MADCYEHSRDVENRSLSGDSVREFQSAHRILPQHFGYGLIGEEPDLVVVLCPFQHDGGSTELLAAVHDSHRLSKLGKEGRFFHGGVAAADHSDIMIAEEEAVTCGTSRDSPTQERLLAFRADIAWCRARGQDDGTGMELLVVDPDLFDLAFKFHLGYQLHAEIRPKALGLRTHVVHKIWPHDALWEAGEVFYLCGSHERAAEFDSLENNGLELSASRIESCGVTGWAGSDDGYVVHCGRVRHVGCFGHEVAFLAVVTESSGARYVEKALVEISVGAFVILAQCSR
ncbi:Hypothetical protein Cul210931_2285 [Corynebacterium ulcerans]|nr:Hypothetical protein Cul210931_2285 [Corynebacterium ulcerans]AIU92858.1 Hypothetical protein Cul05146_2324 [Corynebacterium ulcerans]